MPKRPPLPLTVSFLDCINRGDLDNLCALMTADHELKVFAEPPIVGRDANRAAWEGYMQALPGYVIHPHRLAVHGTRVAILGHTTGSHLQLPDDEESRLTLIWIADVEGEQVSAWTLIEDTTENRLAWSLL